MPPGLLCASTAHSEPHVLLLSALVCAAAGGQVGFWTSRRAGRAALAGVRNRRLRAGADRAEILLARYGYAKALVLGCFIPFVRTVLNPVAGALGAAGRSGRAHTAPGFKQSFAASRPEGASSSPPPQSTVSALSGGVRRAGTLPAHRQQQRECGGSAVCQ